MSEFSENYKNLKDQISDNNSKVIPFFESSSEGGLVHLIISFLLI